MAKPFVINSHSTVEKRKLSNDFSKTHPINHEKNNDALVKHIKNRLDFARPVRDTLVERFKVIDRTVAGFIKLDKDEKKAKQKSQRGDPTPAKSVIQLIQAQLDDENTFLMSVFSPDSSLYEALARQDQQQAANGLALLMNKNAKHMQYYRQYTKGINDMLKYNLGGFDISWVKQLGVKPTFSPQGKFASAEHGVIWEGNEVRALDMYNTFFDPSHHPVDVPMKGEFVAEVTMKTKFFAARLQENKEIFNAQDVIKQESNTILYYTSPPEVQPSLFSTSGTDTQGGTVDWISVLSGGFSAQNINSGVEFITYTGWLRPIDFGLSTEKQHQIWRITIIGGTKVAAATHLTNMHGMLPYAFGSPVEDGLGLQQKSYAEILTPLQDFGAFLLNAHVKGVRKSMYGLTLFDPTVVPLDDVDDQVAAHIPINPAGYGKDVSKSLLNFNDAPPTERTMSDLSNVIDLMQHLLPTDQLKQVAGLDRATQYHAAATVQGANRRSLKIARLLNDQTFVQVRRIQFYNILQFQPSITIHDLQGKPQEIAASSFQNLDHEFIMDEGLKSIDKLQMILHMKDTLNSILQSQEAIQEIDIIKYLNYFTTLMGDQTDLTQFRREPPVVGPDGQQQLQPAPLPQG